MIIMMSLFLVLAVTVFTCEIPIISYLFVIKSKYPKIAKSLQVRYIAIHFLILNLWTNALTNNLKPIYDFNHECYIFSILKV